MNRHPDGKTFVAAVTEKTGVELSHPVHVAILYDLSAENDALAQFGELALYAKSFQKVSRLLATGKANDETVTTAKAELETLLGKFVDTVKNLLARSWPETGGELNKLYLTPTPDSFGNLQQLVSDFGKVKDFLLRERDRSSGA